VAGTVIREKISDPENRAGQGRAGQSGKRTDR